jgi:polysaccharide export outer membrane protein
MAACAFALAVGHSAAENAAMPAAAEVRTKAESETPTARPSVVDPSYQLGPEDIIEISVWREEGLKKELVVRPDGFISFPLVGDLEVAGRTTDDVRSAIVAHLGKLIADPVVSVSVLKVGGNKVYVIGRVNRPGEYVAGRYIDVLQALSMAGGLTPFASENDIQIVRKEKGKDIFIPFRYSDVRKGRNIDQNITLRSGDVIVVP